VSARYDGAANWAATHFTRPKISVRTARLQPLELREAGNNSKGLMSETAAEQVGDEDDV
jgi:hypothetical protein